ncbi:Acb2/Tad1 domain-containing protein [Aeromonas tecta]|uniref:Acb2/Tad1 domain-containing protein n=1 Tax=Aeromonas tecta TaxID=324617 RepID=UPI000680AFA8|nr:hypothetical protein [Aeromonas tecta]
MDNQHRKIAGYRELSQAEIDLMNDIKANGEQLRSLLTRVRAHVASQPEPEVPHSTVTEPMLAIDEAQRLLQSGQMWLVRAVAQPNSF